MKIKIYSIWTLFVVFAVSFFGFCLQVPVFLLCYPFDRNRYVVGRMYRLMAVLCVKLAPTWKFKVTGIVPKKIAGSTIVVSNHTSHADAFLISHLPWEMKWLGKASLFKLPVIGWSMRLTGDIPVERGNKNSIERAFRRCAYYVKQRMPVFIFPEGTRSKDGALLPFKEGAFRLAIETKADILPLAVYGTRTALPKHSWLFGYAKAFVCVGKPIPTYDLTLQDVELLMQKTRKQIEQMLFELQRTT